MGQRRSTRPAPALTPVPLQFHTRRSYLAHQKVTADAMVVQGVAMYSRDLDRLTADHRAGHLPSMRDIVMHFFWAVMAQDQQDSEQLAAYLTVNPAAIVINPFAPESVRLRCLAVKSLAMQLYHARRTWLSTRSFHSRSMLDRLLVERRRALLESQQCVKERYLLLEAKFDNQIAQGRAVAITAGAPVRSISRSRAKSPDKRNRDALIRHHGFDGQSCARWQPIAAKDLAGKVGVSPSVITDFFKRHFGGHRNYKMLCHEHNAEQLIGILRTLTGDGWVSTTAVRHALREIESRRPEQVGRRSKTRPQRGD